MLERKEDIQSNQVTTASSNVAEAQYVRKPTASVHMSNNLSLLARKTLTFLVCKIGEQQDREKNFCVKQEELVDFLGWNSKFSGQFRETIKLLMTTKISWNICNKDKTIEKGVAVLLSQIRFREGNIYYDVSSLVVDWVRFPKLYAQLDIDIHRKIKSKYALALWEFACEDLSTLRRNQSTTQKLELRKLKEMLVDNPDDYESFKRFNDKILKKAVSEINEISDIEVKPILHKHGRTITHISFDIKKVAKQGRLFDDEIDIARSIIEDFMRGNCGEKAKALKLSISCLRPLLEEYGIKLVDATINSLYDEVRRRKNKGLSKIDNIEAYFKAMLKNSGDAISSDDVHENITFIEEEKAQASEQKKKQEIEELIKNQSDDYRNVVAILMQHFPPTQYYYQDLYGGNLRDFLTIERYDSGIECTIPRVAETTTLGLQKTYQILHQMLSDLEKLFHSKVKLRVGSFMVASKKEPTSSEEFLVEETEIA
jgi:hypothetical protein